MATNSFMSHNYSSSQTSKSTKICLRKFQDISQERESSFDYQTWRRGFKVWECVGSLSPGNLEFIESTIYKIGYWDLLKKNIRACAEKFAVSTDFFFHWLKGIKQMAHIVIVKPMAVLTRPKTIPKVNLVPRPKHNTEVVRFTRVNNQGERNTSKKMLKYVIEE
ncbi:hypothetical protein TNCV_2590951 [Trichonephila clavipes]|nr:hypothetical protein TNCV_2590951 [Trichonephila clavipes]